jgi:hypothetical protein
MFYVAILVLLYLVFSSAYFGRLRSEYSHIKHTISELAESNSSTEKLVSLGVFLPIGLVMGLIAFFSRLNEPALLFSISLAVGYGGAALFPIDKDAPFLGSWKNVLHNLSAGVSYILALAAFEYLSREIGFPYSAGKFLIMAFIASLYFPVVREIRGLLQRVAEIGIFSALIACLY